MSRLVEVISVSLTSFVAYDISGMHALGCLSLITENLSLTPLDKTKYIYRSAIKWRVTEETVPYAVRGQQIAIVQNRWIE